MFQQLTAFVINQLHSNQFLITAIFGAIAFIARSIPSKIFGFIRRNITLELEITNENELYQTIIEYVDKKRIRLFSRTYSLKKNDRNYAYDDDDASQSKNRPILTVGYGISLFIYNGVIALISRQFYDGANTGSEIKEHIHIRFFSRKKKHLEKFLNEIHDYNNRHDNLVIYNCRHDWWQKVATVERRSLENVFIPDAIKHQILDGLKWFLENEEWYRVRGINYKFGVLLVGEPGTGKSSLVRAIASHLGRNIRIFPATKVEVSRMIQGVPPDLLVMEDLDTYNFITKRDDDDDDAPVGSDTKKINGMHELLNVLDGSLTPGGLIFIGTTNHPEALDKALIRKGRFDLFIEIGRVNRDDFLRMTSHLFNLDSKIVAEKFKDVAYSPLPGADIQSAFFDFFNDFDGYVEKFKQMADNSNG